mmetsp:Transcript_10196/g.18195  ORF Transcript_10196/g.18195 Transcript_10196/m.18195 type:complete len:219 (-) Transcript_10196:2182-2838(-)
MSRTNSSCSCVIFLLLAMRPAMALISASFGRRILACMSLRSCCVRAPVVDDEEKVSGCIPTKNPNSAWSWTSVIASDCASRPVITTSVSGCDAFDDGARLGGIGISGTTAISVSSSTLVSQFGFDCKVKAPKAWSATGTCRGCIALSHEALEELEIQDRSEPESTNLSAPCINAREKPAKAFPSEGSEASGDLTGTLGESFRSGRLGTGCSTFAGIGS